MEKLVVNADPSGRGASSRVAETKQHGVAPEKIFKILITRIPLSVTENRMGGRSYRFVEEGKPWVSGTGTGFVPSGSGLVFQNSGTCFPNNMS